MFKISPVHRGQIESLIQLADDSMQSDELLSSRLIFNTGTIGMRLCSVELQFPSKP